MAYKDVKIKRFCIWRGRLVCKLKLLYVFRWVQVGHWVIMCLLLNLHRGRTAVLPLMMQICLWYWQAIVNSQETNPFFHRRWKLRSCVIRYLLHLKSETAIFLQTVVVTTFQRNLVAFLFYYVYQVLNAEIVLQVISFCSLTLFHTTAFKVSLIHKQLYKHIDCLTAYKDSDSCFSLFTDLIDLAEYMWC